jgi:spore coat polysaccharide biosynthesis predicted glycosyltransferase SpsG
MEKTLCFITEVNDDDLVGSGHLGRTTELIKYMEHNSINVNIILYVFNPSNLELMKSDIACTVVINNAMREIISMVMENYYLNVHIDLISSILTNDLISGLKETTEKVTLISDDTTLPTWNVDRIILTHPIHARNRLSEKYFSGELVAFTDEKYFQRNNTSTECPLDVLITFGGVDPFDVTQKVIEHIAHNKYINKIHVLLGRYYIGKDSNNIIKYKTDPRFQFYQNMTEVYELFKSVDIAFTAGGNTLYELMAMTVPCFTIAQNDKQHLRCSILNEYGLVNHLGHYKDVHSIDENIWNSSALRAIIKKLKKGYKRNPLKEISIIIGV